MLELGEIRKARDIGYKNKTNDCVWAGCLDCGKERWVQTRGGRAMNQRCRSCSLVLARKQQIGNPPGWKGGKYKMHLGYIMVIIRPNNFFYPMAHKDGYAYEHRLVVATHLGRCLLPWEIVHHKNSVKDDNRIENLELLANSSQHLPDTLAKAHIKRQDKRITELEEKVALLERQLNANS